MKRGVPAAIAAALVIAGCGSSTGLGLSNTKSTPKATVEPTADSSAATSGMAGMSMSSGSSSSSGNGSTAQGATAVPEVNGIKPVPSQVLATTHWQGMTIQARTMTPISYYVFNGSKEREVKPTKHTSFHLMVMLDDEHTNEPIPYATVWATIKKAGKVVYDEPQPAMLSAYMGPHYGNNVTLPGAGKYQLSLLVTPPIAARHVEYKNVWLKKHTINVSFNWKPPAK